MDTESVPSSQRALRSDGAYTFAGLLYLVSLVIGLGSCFLYRYHGLQQGSSSCRAAEAVAWVPSRQQKRQRCQALEVRLTVVRRRAERRGEAGEEMREEERGINTVPGWLDLDLATGESDEVQWLDLAKAEEAVHQEHSGCRAGSRGGNTVDLATINRWQRRRSIGAKEATQGSRAGADGDGAAGGARFPESLDPSPSCFLFNNRWDQVGSSTSDSLQMSEPELQDVDYGENEEEDYYMEDDVDDAGDESEYEFDEADFNQQLADKFDDLDLPPGVEATVPWLQKIAAKEEQGFVTSKLKIEDENAKKYMSFKQFDTVQNFSDHHYGTKSVGETSRVWTKRIQYDWNLLEKDLPAFIYVRVAEDRMDLLRAVIIGPKGTPYHDGLFFFDVQFTSSYPSGPPSVYYHSGGLRLNPNLYNCGKVCLSLLGTWRGTGCEKWNPAQSTMLQVLISIQALILNEKPYFNEPGYETFANSVSGERNAMEYNDTAFLYSCRTMLYSLRRPPEHFADLVAGHFREHGCTILAACKYYMEGNKIGSVVPEEEESTDNDTGASSSSSELPKQQPNKVDALGRRLQFNTNLKTLFEELLMEFNVKGADTKRFLAVKVKKNQPAA